MKKSRPSKAARRLSIPQVGRGDYTIERRKLFAGETADGLFAKARTLETRTQTVTAPAPVNAVLMQTAKPVEGNHQGSDYFSLP
jgi:hypothetical protein